MKALVWPAATYGCESWTLRQNEETRLDAFEMKGLRKILRVSWTAKKTNEWVLNKAGEKRELLDTVRARKLAYNGHTTRKQGSCLEKEIMQGTMPGARRRGRPHRRSPAYLTETVQSVGASRSHCGLRSSSTSSMDYSLPRLSTKFGERAFGRRREQQ